jgi:hypothetical protein
MKRNRTGLEFPEFGTAYYHSAVNYTTLGYGDVIMTLSENAVTARSCEWNAHVRRFDRDHFRCHSKVDSG